SIPWVVACAIVDGKVGIGHFSPKGLQRSDILAFATRIDTVQDDSLVNPRGGPGPVIIEVKTRDGGLRTQYVAAAKGDPEAPMSAAETDSKFADCMTYAGMTKGAGQALRLLLQSIDSLPNVSAITRAMAMKV
ncbi:MAG: MmgE/PrpD family protein, partial [Burkholderiales bacterium PBB4]